MLKKPSRSPVEKSSARIVIITSAYNAKYVDGMLEAALLTLTNAGIQEVELVRVPGAFEIPVVTAKIAQRKRHRPGVIICLGVVLRGQTTHADHIGLTVSHLLGQIAVKSGVPVIHGVLLLENAAQAKTRCLSKGANRGNEAAHTALSMAELFPKL